MIDCAHVWVCGEKQGVRGHGSVYMLVGVIAPVCVLQRSKGPVVAVLIEVPVALIARKLKRDHQSRAFAKHMQNTCVCAHASTMLPASNRDHAYTHRQKHAQAPQTPTATANSWLLQHTCVCTINRNDPR